MEYYKKCPVKGIFGGGQKEIEESPFLFNDMGEKKFLKTKILSCNHIADYKYP